MLLAFGFLAMRGSQLLAAFCYIKQVFAKRGRVKGPCERPYDTGLFSESFNPVHWGLFVSECTPLTQKRMLHPRKAVRHLGKSRSYSDPILCREHHGLARHVMVLDDETITAAR